MPKVKFMPSQERLTLADGRIRTPAFVDISVEGLAANTSVSMRVNFHSGSESLIASRIEFTSPAGVTGQTLRELAVQEYISEAAREFVTMLDPALGKLVPLDDALASVAPARGRDRNQVAREAASIYAMASLIGWRPLKTVAEHLHVSQSTATRLIAEARRMTTGGTFLADQESIASLPVDELKEVLRKPRKPISNDG